MERKTIELFVPYNDKGEQKEKYFKISFISNKMDREYRKILARQQEGLSLIQRYENNISDQGSAIVDIRHEKDKGKRKKFHEKLKDLSEKNKKIQSQIAAFGDSDFFKDRVNLIFIILEANGITDQEAMTFEFWDEKVDPGEVVGFLEKAITKDYVEKKKLNTAVMKTA